jgi:plasmid stabilization system protein ParE
MTFEVNLLPRAEADIQQIVQFLAERSSQGAAAWWQRWEQAIDELRDRPLQLGLAPESSKYDIDVRQLLFKTRRGRTYRALFTVVGRGVWVLTVRGPRQNLLRRSQLRGGPIS